MEGRKKEGKEGREGGWERDKEKEEGGREGGRNILILSVLSHKSCCS